MNDFKRNDRFGGKRFGGKPSFQRAGGGFGKPHTTMYPATCAQCGNTCEVPFRPDGQRPVYCRDCLGGNKAPTSSFEQRKPSFETRRPSFRAPIPAPAAAPVQRVVATDPRIDVVTGQLAKILVKLDQILLGMAVSKAQAIPASPEVKTKKVAKTSKKK